MLNSKDFGYAVMSPDMKGISFESIDLETCKEYCRNGQVIVEQIPAVNGFSISISWHPGSLAVKLHRTSIGIFAWFLGINLIVSKEYRHRDGKIVYRSSAGEES